MTDARFEDGEEGPLHLVAMDREDLTILSALVQDAVLPGSELRYDRKGRKFLAFINRLRREDLEAARRAGQTAGRPSDLRRYAH